MANKDNDQLLDEGLENLHEGTDNESLRQIAAEVDSAQIQDGILERYLGYGQKLLSDELPSRIDPRILKRLEPILGNVSNVRIHSGKVATEAARAMGARAFAIGDRDVFFDQAHLSQNTPEGAALLAHEVAHTRDPHAHFALSGGGSSSEAEARAEGVEAFIYAQEDAAIDPPASSDAEPTAASPGSGSAVGTAPADASTPKPTDLDGVARAVVDLMRAADGRFRDRHGR